MTVRSPITPVEAWEALEKLPITVRRLLAIAPQPYDPVSILAQWKAQRAKGMTTPAYVKALRRAIIPPRYRP